MSFWAGWAAWAVVVAGLTGYLYLALTGEDQTLFLPGETTAGHYQIELLCTACHGTNEDGTVGEVMQSACIDCHQEELDRIGDSHPIAKFAKSTDALMLAPFDQDFSSAMVKSAFCIACHVEHDPEVTRPMGVSEPESMCMACHSDIGENRETHTGLAFTTCLTAGCHNFHDNGALSESFLTKHMHDRNHKPEAEAVRPLRNYGEIYRAEQADYGTPVVALTRADMDAPRNRTFDDSVIAEWESTAHARAGVNCTDCHNQEDEETGRIVWRDQVNYQSCQDCHKDEAHGFLKSRHGMRIDAGLDPMRPELARLEMKASSHGKLMNCNACHGAHTYDTLHAATNSCLECHDDEHSRNFVNSTHHELWLDEITGKAAAGTGVSCATCHLPRVPSDVAGDDRVYVKHNQNDYLRPNEKMVRSVCMSCHGVPFALDALADEDLILANFDAPPKKPHFNPSSFDLITQKLERLEARGRRGDD
ncbi:MAG: cytochrome c3 family protein [Planctomycetota bacterium]